MQLQKTLLSALFAAGALLHAESVLLTDNHRPNWVSNCIPNTQKRIQTGAELEWITTGPFACDPEIVKTGSQPSGSNRALLDARRGPEGDCQAFGVWGGTKGLWASFIIDLKGVYLIESATVWAIQKEAVGTGSFEILLSNDKKQFISAGTCAISDKLRSLDGRGIESAFRLEKPAAARHVQFRIRKRPGAKQQILSEVAVYGKKISEEKARLLSPENQRPEIRFSMKGIQEAGVILDWSESANNVSDVQSWKLYVSDEPADRVDAPGVKLLEKFPRRTTRKVFYPLEPDKVYYFGISAVYREGENPKLVMRKYTVPKPFAYETFGDMLAINYYYGGDGEAVRSPHRHQKAWDHAAIELLGTTPVRQVRWWRLHKHVADLLYDRGIGMLSESVIPEIAAKIGVLTLGCGNEPELSGRTPEQATERIRKAYQTGKAKNPKIVVAAPAVNISGEALQYLDQMYQHGLKNYIDVLDLHTYGGNPKNNPALPGYPQGAPEFLFDAMKKVNAMLRKYGDENKPKISTEFGYTDGQIANPLGFPISREQIAQFLTRGLIIHNVLGFKRVFLYSFWDAGTNPNDTEHHFGMVDYYLQKKPSFYAFCTLGEQLGNTRLDSRMKGTDEKLVYGYNYRDIKTGTFTAVIWDGRGDYSGLFRTTKPGKVEVTQLYGEHSAIQTKPDGTFRTLYGPSVIYIKAPGPVELLKSVKVEKKKEEKSGLRITPARKVFEILPGQKSTEAMFALQNRSGEAYRVHCVLENSAGKSIREKQLTVPAGKTETLAFSLTPTERILDRYRLRLSYEGEYASHSAEEVIYVRTHGKNNGKINVGKKRMDGYDKEVVVLSDDKMEVTVDPARGGRILEILDKTIGGNQVHIDYDHLAGLDRVNFYYTLWDRVRAPEKYAIHQSTPCQAELLPDGIRMTAISPAGMKLVKQLTLDGKGSLKLDVSMTNGGKDPVACSWYLHPEYTVGGTGDHGIDIIYLPVGGKTLSMNFWNGLGNKPTQPFSEGWWKVDDSAKKVRLEQKFDLKKFRTPRLWFGLGCYNLEMESSKGLTLNPGESWNGALTWTLSHF